MQPFGTPHSLMAACGLKKGIALATNPALKNSEKREAFESHLVDDACLIKRKGEYWFH